MVFKYWFLLLNKWILFWLDFFCIIYKELYLNILFIDVKIILFNFIILYLEKRVDNVIVFFWGMIFIIVLVWIILECLIGWLYFVNNNMNINKFKYFIINILLE